VYDDVLLVSNSDNRVCFVDLAEWIQQKAQASTKVLFGGNSMYWDADYSSLYDFAVGGGEDGTLRLNNLQSLSKKGKKSHTIYYRIKSSNSSRLEFRLDKKTQVSTNDRTKMELNSTDIAIHAVAWNHSEHTNTLVCSGGVGWLRSDKVCD
jgi:WD40 repeat protein